MSDVKDVVKDKYGRAALRVVSGEAVERGDGARRPIAQRGADFAVREFREVVVERRLEGRAELIGERGSAVQHHAARARRRRDALERLADFIPQIITMILIAWVVKPLIYRRQDWLLSRWARRLLQKLDAGEATLRVPAGGKGVYRLDTDGPPHWMSSTLDEAVLWTGDPTKDHAFRERLAPEAYPRCCRAIRWLPGTSIAPGGPAAGAAGDASCRSAA